MQRWEYKVVRRQRDVGSVWSVDMVDVLPGLGDEGWELVAVEPRSDTTDFAGITTSDLWIFKRPLEAA